MSKTSVAFWRYKLDFASIRPLIVGTIAGLFVLWLSTKWARFIPKEFNGASRESLLMTYRSANRTSIITFWLTLVSVMVVYSRGWIPRNSTWLASLCFGLVLFLPFVAVLFIGLQRGRQSLVESFVAFAISQNTPPIVMLCIAILGTVALTAGMAGVIIWRLAR